MSRYFFGVTLVTGTILDLLLSLLLTLLAGSSDAFVSFVFFFAIIFFAPSAFALWGLIKGIVFYLWPLRPMMEREYLRVLQSGHFPVRPAYDLDSYLAETVSDEAEATATRIKASYLAGQLNGLKTGKPITVGMFNHLAAERALHKYLDQNAHWRGPMGFDISATRKEPAE